MYYPKSKITPNLYTSGGEYMIASSKTEYIGYYYKTSSGKLYTGRNPQNGPNSLLAPIQTVNDVIESTTSNNLDSNIILYNSIEDGYENYTYLNFSEYPQNKQFISRNTPIYNPTLPTESDKSLGVFNRYFCKKNNELIYIEINKITFNLLRYQDPRIAWDLYSPLSILWKIKGDKEKTYNANKNNISILEQKNKWYGFSKYFKDDFLKYYLGS